VAKRSASSLTLRVSVEFAASSQRQGVAILRSYPNRKSLPQPPRYPVYDKRTLIELVRDRALKFGDFTLASGKKATYYLDGKQVTLDSYGAKLVADGILDLLADNLPLPDAIGGMSMGADPITAAVITMAGVRGQQMSGFLVRKEAKGHGTNRFVEGPVNPGQRVVIVEDVVTTGGSSLEAIARVEEFGLVVSGVVAVIDRLEGGQAAFAARGYRLSSLLTVRDFGIEPPPS
jgi:orotate phosphoribosyltransferase